MENLISDSYHSFQLLDNIDTYCKCEKIYSILFSSSSQLGHTYTFIYNRNMHT